MQKTIGIDFDGVIAREKEKDDFTSIPYCYEAIRRLTSEGYYVYILTARKPREVLEFLNHTSTGGLHFEIIPDHYRFWNKKDTIGISNRKYPAMLYIDDQAYRFPGDWNQALREIKHFI